MKCVECGKVFHWVQTRYEDTLPVCFDCWEKPGRNQASSRADLLQLYEALEVIIPQIKEIKERGDEV